jgi:hypothetical protein
MQGMPMHDNKVDNDEKSFESSGRFDNNVAKLFK